MNEPLKHHKHQTRLLKNRIFSRQPRKLLKRTRRHNRSRRSKIFSKKQRNKQHKPEKHFKSPRTVQQNHRVLSRHELHCWKFVFNNPRRRKSL